MPGWPPHHQGHRRQEAAGAWVFVGGLRPAHAITVVRPANGTSTMTDGPFAETKEQLDGFGVIQWWTAPSSTPVRQRPRGRCVPLDAVC
ncbi:MULTISPECIES: YciI family protein [Amycolatopsis]|uniref:YciI family protein n=1 Tax=Amycolatopsis TaxID=1813 RepID=UPI000AF23FBF|nr:MULTISPECIES: YciI family protein [Amycolatopsis]